MKKLFQYIDNQLENQLYRRRALVLCGVLSLALAIWLNGLIMQGSYKGVLWAMWANIIIQLFFIDETYEEEQRRKEFKKQREEQDRLFYERWKSK